MTRSANSPDDIRDMADEVARLIAARFGGARRGERPPLSVMLRRRGGALPRRLRKEAAALALADQRSAQPKIARQLDLTGLSRSHQALAAHLQPLGELSRWQGRVVGFAASVALGLMVLAAAVVWILMMRGYL
ncbi:hypothetical protein EYF88_13755 [Paracoccus sediminis]|uniref:Uncharacterized protein n=1 Tax=Paracoccus sediminis TaxID=1214787 RepID=A0A238XKA4_9RHOB|nr:hypothetical protein [Paracoccus sediminis]TBN48558.1 hypothetical protein EYF88_13755 [Paracoccus sediminis]SNR59008.1 hypothetical protein SAMN06265378_110107 [Paracoccus sediminis]